MLDGTCLGLTLNTKRVLDERRGMAQLFSVLKRVIFTSQLYGIFPYTLEGGMFRLSVPRLVYFGFMIVVTLYWISSVLATAEPSYPTTAVDYTFSKVKFSVWTVSTIVTMVVMVFIGSRLNSWLKIVLKCQEIMAHSKTDFTYRYMWSLIHHLTHIIVIIGKITSYDSLEYTKSTYGTYYLNLASIAFVDHFTGLVCILTDIMMELNRVFSKPTLEQVEASVVAYERLASGSGELSEAYGIQLLVTVAGNFILVTSNAFLLVNETVTYRRIWFAMQCILPGMATFRLVHACVCLVNESEEFNSLLRNTLVDKMNSNLSQSARIRLHLSMRKKIEFTTKGFFTLDYSLLSTMLGAVATYLVIIIQFGESPEEKPIE